jgi:hypothetical protein
VRDFAARSIRRAAPLLSYDLQIGRLFPMIAGDLGRRFKQRQRARRVLLRRRARIRPEAPAAG